MTKKPKISIILPVYNSEKYLEKSLNSIRTSEFKDYELIIIDDASTDSTIDTVKKHNPDILLINEQNKGRAYTRNKAAKAANGDILYFTDADIELQKSTLTKVYSHFQDKSINCVIGLYSLPSRDVNIFTIYKTTWIRFSYLNSPENVNWFFAAVGAVRKNIWEKSPNFKNHPPKTDGSDINFGFDLSSADVNILLDKTLEVKHIKKYSLKFLLANDFNRAFRYTQMSLKSFNIFANIHRKGFANISKKFIIGTILSFLSFSALTISIVLPQYLLFFLFFFIINLFINFKFYLYVKKCFSLRTALLCVGIMFIDQLVCFLGIVCAFINSFLNFSRKKINLIIL